LLLNCSTRDGTRQFWLSCGSIRGSGFHAIEGCVCQVTAHFAVLVQYVSCGDHMVQLGNHSVATAAAGPVGKEAASAVLCQQTASLHYELM
jgi:hypothetical protein